MAVIAIGISGMVIMNEEHTATIAHIRLVIVEIQSALDDCDYKQLVEDASFLGQLAYHALKQQRSTMELQE